MKTLHTILSLFALMLTQPLSVVAAPAGQVIYWGYVPESAPWPSNGVVTIAGQVVTNAVSVSAGYMHALALRNDGVVVGWGLNSSGQATGSKLTTPDRANGIVEINGVLLNDVVAIATGSHSSLALRGNGTIASWGAETNVPVEYGNAVAIAAGGRNALALRTDGKIVGWGGVIIPPGLSNIIAIAMGGTWGSFGVQGGVGLALKNDGAIIEWNTRNGETDTALGLNDVVAISAREMHCLALKQNGTVAGWGADNFGATSIPNHLTNVVAIATGSRHSLALKNDGTVITWGYNPRHALDVPAGLSNVVAIAAGNDFSLAITTNCAVAEKFRH